MTRKSNLRSVKTPLRNQERIRTTLDLSVSGHDRLERLAKSSNMSIATVLRQALQLYEFVVEKTVEGAQFKCVDKSGKETEITFLGYTD